MQKVIKVKIKKFERLFNNNFSQCFRFRNEQDIKEHTLFQKMKIYAGLRLEIPFVEYAVTTRCTLKCKKCSNLIPYMYPGKDISIYKVKEEIENFLKYVDFVYRFKIHGGEPFLYKDIAEVLELLVTNEKVGEVRISTNGTIIPDKDVLKKLKNHRVCIFVSDYGKEISPNREKLIEILKEENIRFRDLRNQEWSDTGDFALRNEAKACTDRKIKNCFMANSKALADNKFYVCSRCANGDKLGFFEEKVYVLLKGKKSTVRRNLRKMYSRTDFVGCRHCDSVNDQNVIPAGEQIV